jgi:hypothetical protein
VLLSVVVFDLVCWDEDSIALILWSVCAGLLIRKSTSIDLLIAAKFRAVCSAACEFGKDDMRIDTFDKKHEDKYA